MFEFSSFDPDFEGFGASEDEVTIGDNDGLGSETGGELEVSEIELEK